MKEIVTKSTQVQKQNFIGGPVAGTLVKVGVRAAIETALKKVAARHDVAMDKEDVLVATAVVVDEVQRKMEARVEHVTDTELHRSSRNVWGSLVGIICAADVIYKMWTDDVTNDPMDYVTQIGLIASILTPLYSRFIAKKPLFS